MITSAIALTCSVVMAAYWVHYLCAHLLLFGRYPSQPRLLPGNPKKT